VSDARRWVIVVLAVLLAVALLAWARGRDHHRGDDVGEHASGATSSAAAIVAGGVGV
jgi:H+/gluconate symporter-like permease